MMRSPRFPGGFAVAAPCCSRRAGPFPWSPRSLHDRVFIARTTIFVSLLAPTMNTLNSLSCRQPSARPSSAPHPIPQLLLGLLALTFAACGGGGGGGGSPAAPAASRPALANIGAARSFTVGTDISAITFTNTGGSPQASGGCTATGLPDGLVVARTSNGSTCQITGNPTAVAASAEITITARNSGGTDTATITITVTAAVVANPPNLGDITTTLTSAAGTPITPVTFTNTGADVQTGGCRATGLPTGLSVSVVADAGKMTCRIEGTPQAPTSGTVTVTVTADSGQGTTTATASFNFTLGAPSLTAPLVPLTYYVGQTGRTFSLSNTGGGVLNADNDATPGCASATNLPATLSLGRSSNGATCVITGDPTAAISRAGYQITATNASGSAAATLFIEVLDPPASVVAPALSAPTDDQSLAVMSGFEPVIFANSGGAPNTCAAKSGSTLPSGLAFDFTMDGASCRLTGFPIATAAAADYTVVATNSADSSEAAVNVEVVAATPPQTSAFAIFDANGFKAPNEAAILTASGSDFSTPTVTTAAGSDAAARATYDLGANPATDGAVISFKAASDVANAGLFTTRFAISQSFLAGAGAGLADINGVVVEDMRRFIGGNIIFEINAAAGFGGYAMKMRIDHYVPALAGGAANDSCDCEIDIDTSSYADGSWLTVTVPVSNLTGHATEALNLQYVRTGIVLYPDLAEQVAANAAALAFSARNIRWEGAADGPPPVLTAPSGTQTFANGAVAHLLLGNAEGGPPDSCMAAPALPSGLAAAVSEGGTTCAIAGVPGDNPGTTTHTITGTNGTGATTASVSIELTGALPAPNLPDATTTAAVGDGVAIGSVSLPNSGGAAASCAFVDSGSEVGAALAGLNVALGAGGSSCELSGALALSAGATQTFTVRATNTAGPDDATVVFTVSLLAPNLPNTTATVTGGAAIAETLPNSGGAAASCAFIDSGSEVGTLAGLSVALGTGGASCDITGALALSAGATQAFTVRATNATGSDEASLEFTVEALLAPNLSDDTATATDGVNIAEVTLENTGGAAASCAFIDSGSEVGADLAGLSVALGAGGASCVISGILAFSAGATQTFTVRATNAAGPDDATVEFTVDMLSGPNLPDSTTRRTATDGVDIAEVSLPNTGGAAASCAFIDSGSEVGTLAGLSVALGTGGASCDITGRLALTANATQAFTVRATNTTDSDNATVEFTVMALPAPNLPDTDTAATATDNELIPEVSLPNSGGAATSCAFYDSGTELRTLGALRVTLGQGGASCVVSGTLALRNGAMQAVVVRATNPSGPDDATINFTVQPAVIVTVPPALPAMAMLDATDMTEISPPHRIDNGGGAASACLFVDDDNNQQASLRGLSVAVANNGFACDISGAPLISNGATQMFTILARNTLASNAVGQDTLELTVNVAPRVPKLPDAPITESAVSGVAIDRINIPNTGGDLTTCAFLDTTGGGSQANEVSSVDTGGGSRAHIATSNDKRSCIVTGAFDVANGTTQTLTVRARNTSGFDDQTLSVSVVAPSVPLLVSTPAEFDEELGTAIAKKDITNGNSAATAALVANSCRLLDGSDQPIAANADNETYTMNGLILSTNVGENRCEISGTPDTAGRNVLRVRATVAGQGDSNILVLTFVVRQEDALAFELASYSSKVGDPPKVIATPTVPSGKTSLTWMSSATAIATVDPNGTVTIVGEGMTTITAATTRSDEYLEASASYTLVVGPELPSLPDVPQSLDVLRGVPIGTYTMAITGGLADSCSFLTAGTGGLTETSSLDGLMVALSTDKMYCEVTGTLGRVEDKVFRLRATNTSGSDMQTVTFRVVDAVSPVLSVAANNIDATLNMMITPVTVMNGVTSFAGRLRADSCRLVGMDGMPLTANADMVSYTVAGLTLTTDETNNQCSISGTPTKRGENLLRVQAVVASASSTILDLRIFARGPDTLTFAEAAVSKTSTDAPFAQIPSAASSAASFTWSSDAPAVATVDAADGTVTIVGVGTATITAATARSAGYEADSASYTLTVTLAAPDLPDETVTAPRTVQNIAIQTLVIENSGGALTACLFEVDDGAGTTTEMAATGGLTIAVSTDKRNCEIDGTFTTTGLKTFAVLARNVLVTTATDGTMTMTDQDDTTMVTFNVVSPSIPTLVLEGDVDAMLSQEISPVVTVRNTNTNTAAALLAGSCRLLDEEGMLMDTDTGETSTTVSGIELDTSGNTCSIGGTPTSRGANVLRIRAASADGNSNTLEVTVFARTADTLTFAQTSHTRKNGDAASVIATPTAISGEDSFAWTSSTPATATVNPTTGEVTILATGTTTITAATAQSAGYLAAMASYLLTVNPADPDLGDDTLTAPQAVAGRAIQPYTVPNDGGPPTPTADDADSCAFVIDPGLPAEQTSLTHNGLTVAVSEGGASCTLTGTIAAAGTHTFTVRATNVSGSNDATVTIEVLAALPVFMSATGTASVVRTAELSLDLPASATSGPFGSCAFVEAAPTTEAPSPEVIRSGVNEVHQLVIATANIGAGTNNACRITGTPFLPDESIDGAMQTLSVYARASSASSDLLEMPSYATVTITVDPRPANLAAPGNLVLTERTTNNLPFVISVNDSTGDPATECSSTELAAGSDLASAGLKLIVNDDGDCQIQLTTPDASGPTPTVAPVDVTVRATNASTQTADSATFSVEIDPPAPALTDPLGNLRLIVLEADYTLEDDDGMPVDSMMRTLPMVIANGGGAATSCTSESFDDATDALRVAGLTLGVDENGDCVIDDLAGATGPSRSVASASHTITASNAANVTSSVTFSIRVEGIRPDLQDGSAIFGVGIDNEFVVTNSGGGELTEETGCGIAADGQGLPAGVSVAPDDALQHCVISGTPAIASSAADYRIVATNSTGSSRATVRLEVVDGVRFAPDDFYELVLGDDYTGVNAIEIKNDGGRVDAGASEMSSCAITPELPEGLALEASAGGSCQISGRPIQATGFVNLALTAGNVVGQAMAEFDVVVVGEPPDFGVILDYATNGGDNSMGVIAPGRTSPILPYAIEGRIGYEGRGSAATSCVEIDQPDRRNHSPLSAYNLEVGINKGSGGCEIRFIPGQSRISAAATTLVSPQVVIEASNAIGSVRMSSSLRFDIDRTTSSEGPLLGALANRELGMIPDESEHTLSTGVALPSALSFSVPHNTNGRRPGQVNPAYRYDQLAGCTILPSLPKGLRTTSETGDEGDLQYCRIVGTPLEPTGRAIMFRWRLWHPGATGASAGGVGSFRFPNGRRESLPFTIEVELTQPNLGNLPRQTLTRGMLQGLPIIFPNSGGAPSAAGCAVTTINGVEALSVLNLELVSRNYSCIIRSTDGTGPSMATTSDVSLTISAENSEGTDSESTLTLSVGL